jgi:hypothetical protein
MPSPSILVTAFAAFLLVVSPGQARAAGEQPIEPDAAMLAEMEAAPLRDVPAEGAPQVAPAVMAILAGGDWLFEGEYTEVEDEAQPATTTAPPSCATGAQLREALMSPPDIGGLKCTSQARVWPRGSHQVWTCSNDDERFTATRLIVVQGEYLSAIDETSMRDVNSKAVDTSASIKATTAHGGACPGTSE